MDNIKKTPAFIVFVQVVEKGEIKKYEIDCSFLHPTSDDFALKLAIAMFDSYNLKFIQQQKKELKYSIKGRAKPWNKKFLFV
jgi:hypothetical protein